MRHFADEDRHYVEAVSCTCSARGTAVTLPMKIGTTLKLHPHLVANLGAGVTLSMKIGTTLKQQLRPVRPAQIG